MATQETVKQITQGGVTRDVEDTTARQGLASKVDKNGTDSLMTAAEHTKLAGIADGAEVNVQIDWNATSGDAAILNKPNLATVSTSGNYNDLSNKPTIPDVSNFITESDLETALGNFEPASGKDGITPHIDAVTGNWFIGDENTGVPATGPKGNSGVASGDEVVVVNDLDGEPSDLESGQVAVLSAEQGKYLGDRTLIETGTFGDAHDKALGMNVPFPWLLDDTDDLGNVVKKMMWHAGNGKFIDAVGGEVEGDKNGLTVVCINPCVMRIYSYDPTNQNSIALYDEYNLSAGVNNFPLSVVGNGTGASRKNTIRFYESSESSTELLDNVTKIDFGGMEFLAVYTGNLLHGQTELTTVKRLKIVNNDVSDVRASSDILYGCTKLSYLDLSGKISYWTTNPGSFMSFMRDGNNLTYLDLSKITINVRYMNEFLRDDNNKSTIQILDISGIKFSTVLQCNSFCSGQRNISKVIVGDFSNTNITEAGDMFRFTGNISTLVCRTLYPPTMTAGSFNFLNIIANNNSSKFGTSKGKILVPPGSKSRYDAATCWSDYSAIIEEFSSGEYEVIDNTPTP